MSVVDNFGNLLTKKNDSAAGLSVTQLSHQQDVEQTYRSRILEILTPVFGEGNVQAQVDVSMNFRQTETTSEDFDSNGAGPKTRSETLAEDRTNKLETDLRYYYGVMWRDLIIPSQATANYVKRIQNIEPYLLVAHHYTRYMGDLSGGQILSNITQKSLNLTTEGLKFYEFDIPNMKEYKDKYRQTLNDLPMSSEQIDMLIDEANYAFKLNMLLFDELQGNPIKSIVKVLYSYLKERFKR